MYDFKCKEDLFRRGMSCNNNYGMNQVESRKRLRAKCKCTRVIILGPTHIIKEQQTIFD